MVRRFSVLVVLLLAATGVFAQKPGQSKAVDAEGHPWWKHAVFYEIYPRSFADTNNDGVGDLKGIDRHMDYLHWLGVSAIWITPMFPSPQVDFGYDVSDYENVNPEYGTLADMDGLLAHGKKEDVRVILDFVVNHTSDKHPWFVESRSSLNNPKRDWYVWRDGKGPGVPPNNWTAIFGGSGWKLDPTTNQYYYHYFYAEQPDLNWRNPEVEKAMFDVTRWWYKRGVAGFRLDAVDTMYEDPEFQDNSIISIEKNVYGDPITDEKYNKKLPEVHAALQRLRKVADEHNAVLIGETWTSDIAELKKYYGENNDEIQMPMDFMFTTINRLSPAEFRKQIAELDASGGWPVYVLSNHDIRRAYDRYGDGTHNDQIAKLMAALQLTLRGTPILYYGEELGMENNDPQRVEDVKDPIGKRGWPKEKGRDGERTPMQWSAARNAGFSEAQPWNPVDPKYQQYNVEAERKDPKSILNWYRKLLTLRRTNAALREGNYTALNEDDPNVLAYMRSYKGQNTVVVLNMSGTDQKVKLAGVQGKIGTTLATSVEVPKRVKVAEIALPAYAAWVGEVK